MISTDLYYPDQLPFPQFSGYTFEDVQTFSRSPMASGRASQYMEFDFVPTIVNVVWVLDSDSLASLFRSWFRDVIHNGAAWFNMPLATPIGDGPWICRFTEMYKGPNKIGACTWRVSAQLELMERPIMKGDWAKFPQWLAPGAMSQLDISVNHVLPENK